jgi:hypothetical protein
MLNEAKGYFQEIYKGDTLEDTKNYSDSSALNFMTSRSVLGSVSYGIIPDNSLDEYIKSLELS